MTLTERAAIAEAIAALEPFAKESDGWEAGDKISYAHDEWPIADNTGLTVGDLRHARDALASLRAVATAPADQSDAGRDGAIAKIFDESRKRFECDLGFAFNLKRAEYGDGYFHDGISAMWSGWERAFRHLQIALASAPRKAPKPLAQEPGGDPGVGRGEVEALRNLVVRLSGSLTDEGPDWSDDGLYNLRIDVATTLPRNMRPDWLNPFVVVDREPVALALSTADRDAIREKINVVKLFLDGFYQDVPEVAEATAAVTAALALIGPEK